MADGSERPTADRRIGGDRITPASDGNRRSNSAHARIPARRPRYQRAGDATSLRETCGSEFKLHWNVTEVLVCRLLEKGRGQQRRAKVSVMPHPLPLRARGHASVSPAQGTRPQRDRRRPRVASPSLIAGIALIAFAFASEAAALSFQVDFVESNYATQSGDTFSDLLARHHEGNLIQSTTTEGLENISTTIYAAGVRENYSLLMTTTLEVAAAGVYTFQVGTDWGRGGAAALIDNRTNAILEERVIEDNVWWSNRWDHEDVFTTTVDLSAGESYTLQWVGFEDCCGGSSTVRFAVDGSAFMALTEENASPYVVPEPGTALLLGLGLVGLTRQRRSPDAGAGDRYFP